MLFDSAKNGILAFVKMFVNEGTGQLYLATALETSILHGKENVTLYLEPIVTFKDRGDDFNIAISRNDKDTIINLINEEGNGIATYMDYLFFEELVASLKK